VPDCQKDSTAVGTAATFTVFHKQYWGGGTALGSVLLVKKLSSSYSRYLIIYPPEISQGSGDITRRLYRGLQSGNGSIVIIIIIIIIIICHYNPLWGFAFSAKSLQVLLSLAASFQFLTFSFFRSSMTSSCHRCLGLPTGLVSIGFQSNSFLVGLAWSIFWICPSHLILCALTL